MRRYSVANSSSDEKSTTVRFASCVLLAVGSVEDFALRLLRERACRIVLCQNPSPARAQQKRGQLSHGLGGRVPGLGTIPNVTRLPCPPHDEMVRGFLIDEKLMRNIAVEASHLRPDLPSQ